MKKILLATTLMLAWATAAQAQVNLDVNFGGPAYVEQPAPYYVRPQPYYTTYGHTQHHHEYDYDYYRHDDHHDNGRHLGQERHDPHH